MPNLISQKCIPCEGGVAPLKREEFSIYLEQIKDWNVVNDLELERDFTFKNFGEALKFINQVGALAENEGHHPDIYLHNWNKVRLNLKTHAIGGLSINDFILSTKIDEIFANRSSSNL